MIRNLKQILVAISLGLTSSYVLASFPEDIQFLESKIPQNKACENCSLIQNVKLLDFDEKEGELTFLLNIVSNKSNFINLNLPLSSLEILDAKIKDTNSTLLMRRDISKGFIYAVVPKGETDIIVKAKLLESKIPLNFNDANIVSEIDEKKIVLSMVGNQLYLMRAGSELSVDLSKKNNKIQNFTLSSEPLFNVDRKLKLGKTWYLETTVSSLFSSTKDYIKVNNQIKIPLLNGEKIVSENVKLEDGLVFVNLDSSESQTWTSTLESLSSLEVKPIGENILQKFSIDEAGTDWLFTIQKNKEKVKSNILNLWPSDSLLISFDLPNSKKGDFNVVKSVNLSTSLNKQNIQNTWDVKVESSLGGSFTIDRNNDKSQITSFKNQGGQDVSYQENNSKLTFFLENGNNRFHIETLEKKSPQLIEANQKWDFGVPTYNYKFQMNNNSNRWIMWAGGDMVKPSVLLLGYVILVAIFSFFLAKMSSMFNAMTWALILFGLTNIPVFFTMLMVLSLILISRKNNDLASGTMDKVSLEHWTKVIVLCAIYAVGTMVSSAAIGLLGSSESFIVSIYGDSSLVWMTDIYNKNNAYILSLPQYCFKVFMFVWSLWLAFIIVKIITIVIGFIKKINE